MEEGIDLRALRDAFGAFMTGVTVVTAVAKDGSPVGFTANSFSSVSLEPPLLAVCIAKSSRNYDNFANSEHFGINILSEDQIAVSNTFARPVEDRFSQVEWHKSKFDVPIIDHVSASFTCLLEKSIEAGDHLILLGRVIAFTNSAASGLGYARGRYVTSSLAGKAVAAAAANGTVKIAAVTETHGAIYLLKTENGQWTLPETTPQTDDAVKDLQDYLRNLSGCVVDVGFPYSIYENRGNGQQHIVYRALMEGGSPKEGQLFSFDEIPFDKLVSSSTADVIKRYIGESKIGNFTVYFGNEHTGSIHPVSRKV